MRAFLRSRQAILAVLVLGFFGFLLLQNLATPPARQPLARPGASIILVTVEGLRWDYSRFTGLENLESLEHDSISFRAALTPSPQSLPAHASVMTGDDPPHHGLRGIVAPPLPPGAVTLAEILKADGYRTGAFISSPFLDRRFGLDQGFDRYDDNRIDGRKRTTCSAGSLGSVTRSAIDWLDEGDGRPFFLWLQYRVPPFEARRLDDRPRPGAPPGPGHYASAVLLLDEEIGRLFDALRERGLWDPVLFVLAGVHGEALGEVQETGHGLFLSEATIRVPFLVKLTEGRELTAGDIVSGVSLIDIRPTLLDLVSVADHRQTDGHSLLPLMNGRDLQEREIYVESSYPRDQLGGPVLRGLRSGSYVFLEGWGEELQYRPVNEEAPEDRLVWDPQRQRRMRQRLEDITAVLEDEAVTPEPGGGLDPDFARQLRNCGFLEQRRGRPPDTASAPTASRAVELQAWLTRARGLLSRGSLQRAEKVLREAIALDPENPAILQILALIRDQRGEREDARTFLGAALERDPLRPSIYEDLADVLQESGDAPAAARILERGCARLPTSVILRGRLAAVRSGAGDEDGAAEAWSQVLRLDPGNPEALRGLAEFARRRGQLELAVARLRAILEHEPGAVDVRLALGETLLQVADRPAGGSGDGRRPVLEAIGEFRDVLARDPGNRAATRGLDQARKRLRASPEQAG